MKKRGFTLTEIVLSVTILVSIGLIVALGFNKMFDQNKDETKLSFEDQVLSSTDLYLLNNQNLMNELQTERGYITITIGQLMSAGFLDSNLLDPETNEV
ncbi:MAG TPA: type II secretion system protein, partial [Mollicutes bacterium]|nr:type II secretion system protein [Mollicutes bacterium]